MTASLGTHGGRRTGSTRLVAALGGAAVLFGVGLTSASYTDDARLHLGSGTAGSGVGNPNHFDIAMQDADGSLHDARTEPAALLLELPDDAQLTETTPVEVDVVVVNRDTSIAGDLLLQVYDPDPGQGDPWGALRFTITLDDSATPAISHASADQVNGAGIRFENVAPGQSHQVRISVVLAQGSAAGLAGESTGIAVRVDGESR